MARTKAVKRKKGNHSAEDMLRAIKLHRDGWSVRKAAKECGVAYPTLYRYFKKNVNISNTELATQKLTPNYDVNRVFTEEQESQLDEYIKDCASKFYGLTSNEVRSVAYQMAHINNIKCPANWEQKQMAGIEWLRSFRSRHPDLSLKKPEPCSLARATAFNRTTVSTFFNNLRNVIDRHPYFGNGCRLYNLDETATTTVQKPQKVLAPKGRQNLGKITSGERGTLVTTCAIVCASGQALPPVLVFPRKVYKDIMVNGAPPGTLGLTSPSGWMNSELFVKVMQHFIQHTSASPENPALLLMDNHESHLSIEALDLAKRSGVCVLTLHPHTTAKLQPLDVGLNGPFKTYYNTAIDSWLRRNPGKQVTIYNVAECVGQAYQKAMTPINISAAFKKCGIFPFNPDIFEDIDFMPSEVTDREAPESSAALLVSHSPPLGNREQPEPSPLSDVTFIESPVPRDAESPSVLEEHEPVVDKSCAVELSAESKNFSVISTREITPPPAVAECSSSGSNNLSVIPIREITPPPAVAECSSSGTRGKFIPPKEFMPPLKAGPRSGGRKPRKLGRSLIATDTPEKNEIAEERNKAKQRKSAAKKAKRPVLTDKKRKCKRKKTNDNLLQDDETSEEEDITVVCLSDSDLSNIDDEEEEDSDDDLPLVTGNFNKLDRNPKDGEYVMVCFETKKLLIHYLALITEKISTNTYGVSFLRLKNKSEMKFVMPLEPDLSEIKLSDIKMILPQPKINGTKNRNSTYIFPIRVTPNLNLR